MSDSHVHLAVDSERVLCGEFDYRNVTDDEMSVTCEECAWEIDKRVLESQRV